MRLVDDPNVYEVDVERHAPGWLSHDLDTLRRLLPSAIDSLQRLIEENFASDLFVSPAQIERETTQRLERILHPMVELREIETPLLEERTILTNEVVIEKEEEALYL